MIRARSVRRSADTSLLITVIIPVRNGAHTIARCLEAVFASRGLEFEVIVVDDASEDGSAEIARRFPCRLVRLEHHQGAAAARNAGAAQARGELFFFTDADCLLREDTLATAYRAVSAVDAFGAVGGTYTPGPADHSFFSRFQSAFIHYCETKRAAAPDYLSTHALAIRADAFRGQGGFTERSLPILEDVEFSHRLRRAGFRLVLDPSIQVRHLFCFDLMRSLRNACVKSMYWTQYSLRNGDLLADSGTASHELKVNVAAFSIAVPCLGAFLLTGAAGWLVSGLAVAAANLLINRGLLGGFRAAGDWRFSAAAALYYFLVYPLAVGAGAVGGAARFLAAIRSPRAPR